MLSTDPKVKISVTFQRYDSPLYPRAVNLAQKAPMYFQHDADEVLVHQAVFEGSSGEDYKFFISLYKLLLPMDGNYKLINGTSGQVFQDRSVKVDDSQPLIVGEIDAYDRGDCLLSERYQRRVLPIGTIERPLAQSIIFVVLSASIGLLLGVILMM